MCESQLGKMRLEGVFNAIYYRRTGPANNAQYQGIYPLLNTHILSLAFAGCDIVLYDGAAQRRT